MLSLLDAGDHVVAGDDLYGGSFRLFDKVFRRLGLTFHLRRRARSRRRSPPRSSPSTKLVWLETPTNPLLKLADIRAVAARLRARAACACASTTPS